MGASRRFALLAALAALPACFGLSEADQQRLDFFRENSLGYAERGDHRRALHQAEMALSLDDELLDMRIIRAESLLAIGRTTRNHAMVIESVAAFEAMAGTRKGLEQSRVMLGLGAACLARARDLEREIGLAERQAASTFLSTAGRAAETARLAALRAERERRLARSEQALRTALGREMQGDNLRGLIDLVLVLGVQPGRQEEAIETARRAIVLLDESWRVARTTLDRNKRLPAAARVELQKRLEDYHAQELILRDMLANVHLSRSEWPEALEQLDVLAAKDLLGEAQYYTRADVNERLGRIDEAIADLETVQRLRVRRFDYETDELAQEIFSRLNELRGRRASP